MKRMAREPNGFDDFLPYRSIPAEEVTLREQGYRFLGWQVSSRDNDELARCVELGHNKMGDVDTWHSKQHNSRGSDVTYWCPADRIYWKIDMSD